MGRTPCCEKMGVKKGPWTVEEDQILISHIQQYGHGNWRALPKQAGLLRCGKSCRLRWTNYLRPDIKRGNFSREEQESIIKLHQILGNRWSAIAARLPGRTDNEIKNFWHTHLKKKLEQYLIATPTTMGHFIQIPKCEINNASTSQPENFTTHRRIQSPNNSLQVSPDQFSGELSTSSDPSAAMATTTQPIKEEQLNAASTAWPFSHGFICEPMNGTSSNVDDDMKFWYNLLVKSGESIDLHPKCEQSG